MADILIIVDDRDHSSFGQRNLQRIPVLTGIEDFNLQFGSYNKLP